MPASQRRSPPNRQRELISAERAAKRAGVSTRTIRRWITNGTLRGYRVGTTLVRVDAADVDQLIKPIAAAGNGRRRARAAS